MRQRAGNDEKEQRVNDKTWGCARRSSSGSQCKSGSHAVKPQERENSPGEGRWESTDELLSSGISKGYLPTIMIQSDSNLPGAVGQDLEGPRAAAYRHPS